MVRRIGNVKLSTIVQWLVDLNLTDALQIELHDSMAYTFYTSATQDN